MQQLDNYNNALHAIYSYFGFVEDWAVFPIADAREYWWEIVGHKVEFWDSLEAYRQQDDMHQYSNELLHHRFYPKAVYEGKDYTMILVDTRTDGNKFLQIFDNAKRLPPKEQ